MKVWEHKMTETVKVFSLKLIDRVVRVEGNDEDGEYHNFVGLVHEVEPEVLELRLIDGSISAICIEAFIRDDGYTMTVFTEEQVVLFE